MFPSLFVCVIILINTQLAHGTHFAYGTISWDHVSGTSSYQINFESAWRTDYGWDEGTPSTTVGSAGNTIALGNVYFGSSMLATNGPKWSVVTRVVSIQPNDWFVGVASATVTLSTSSSGKWYLYYYECCRLSTIQLNNHDANVYLTAVIPTTNAASSPTATTLPRTLLMIGSPLTYAVPAHSALGNALTYTFTSSTTYSGLLTNPGIPAPWALDSKTGLLTWTTPACCVGNLYTLQFTITDSVTAASIVLDEIFELATFVANSSPYFLPALPLSFLFPVNASTSYIIQAVSNATNSSLVVYSTPLPSGATLTQLHSSSSLSSSLSVATYSLYWNPTGSQVGRSVCFTIFSIGIIGQSLGSNCVAFVVNVPPMSSTSIQAFSSSTTASSSSSTLNPAQSSSILSNSSSILSNSSSSSSSSSATSFTSASSSTSTVNSSTSYLSFSSLSTSSIGSSSQRPFDSSSTGVGSDSSQPPISFTSSSSLSSSSQSVNSSAFGANTTSTPPTSSPTTYPIATTETPSYVPTTTTTPPTTSCPGIASFAYSYTFFDLTFTSSSIDVVPSRTVYDVLLPSHSLLSGVKVQLNARFLVDNNVTVISYHVCHIGTSAHRCLNHPVAFGQLLLCPTSTSPSYSSSCSNTAFVPVSDKNVNVNVIVAQQYIQVAVYAISDEGDE